MPNHVSHVSAVAGPAPALDAFRAAIAGPGCALDFNRIIPMPQVLRGSESGSRADFGLAVLGHDEKELNRLLTAPWVAAAGVTTREELIAWAKAEQPEWIAAGERALACIEATGFRSWYPWAIESWGTKWNAYATSWEAAPDGGALLRFQTAWSPPEPIFKAMARMPEAAGLTIDVRAFDEGWNFAFVGHVLHGAYFGESVAATADLYRTVYGQEPPLNEDDEPF